MPRKKLVRSTIFPYHLTARANNREPFHGDLSGAWNVLTSELYLQQILHGVQVHAFVLMPNHFHLIATSPSRGIDLVMKEALGSSTRILNAGSGRSGHVFGGRYYWSLIKQPDYYLHALKYVLRNPVKAGLCASVSGYAFSTYSGLLGKIYLPLKVLSPKEPLARLVPRDPEKLDEWLNTPHGGEQNDAIRKALRRKEFEFPKTRARRASYYSV